MTQIHLPIPRLRQRSAVRFWRTGVQRTSLLLALASPLLCGSPAWAQQFSWAQAAVGAEVSRGTGTAADAEGNAYVVGQFFGGSITLGEGQPGETSLANPSGSGSFLAKYDKEGALLWAQSLTESATGSALARDVALDEEGNAYVAGDVSGTVTLGAADYSETIWADAEGDALVAKYDASGKLLWARSSVGGTSDFAGAIAVDGRGIVRVAGGFGGTARFGEGEAHETELIAAAPERSGFIASYAADGALGLARVVPVIPVELAADAQGNVYLTGFFQGTVRFGKGRRAVSITSAGRSDAFTAKYDCDGAFAWVRRDGGPNEDFSSAIAVDSQGQVYVSGIFERQASFGAGQENAVELTSPGVYSSFFASYDSGGAFRWVHTTGGDGKLAGLALTADASDNVYMGGQYLGRVVLGEGEANETVLRTPSDGYPGPDDIFVAKFRPSGALVWARSELGPQEIENVLAIAVDPLHGLYITGEIQGTVTFGRGEPTETTFTRSAETVYVARYDAGNPGGGDTDYDGAHDRADKGPRLDTAVHAAHVPHAGVFP
jgi:hypothetical protein